MTRLNTLLNNETVIRRIEYFLIFLFILLIAWDFYLALDKLDDNTISRVIQEHVSSGVFILTYFWGAVCANVFFPLKNKPKINPTTGTIIMYVIALLIWIVDAGNTIETMLSAELYKNVLGMAFGFIIGFVFWRQWDSEK